MCKSLNLLRTELSASRSTADATKLRGRVRRLISFSLMPAGFREIVSARKFLAPLMYLTRRSYSCSWSINLQIRQEVSAHLCVNDRALLSVYQFILTQIRKSWIFVGQTQQLLFLFRNRISLFGGVKNTWSSEYYEDLAFFNRLYQDGPDCSPADVSIDKLDVCLSVHRCISVEKKNQLDVTELFIALMICSTSFGHLYVHHKELETICVLLPPMVCCAWLMVVVGQVQGSRLYVQAEWCWFFFSTHQYWY